MPQFFDDDYNENLDLAENNFGKLISLLEQEEEDQYYRAMGPRAFGPDADDDS